ncbi:MAG: dienelactone hydrolase family protein [Proteobacteria bacterium]|nr:dienelactone hydrolase family protein [Pseudomonadota bacterium]
MLELPLSSLHRPAAAHAPNPWLLVLMHGVGSNEQDLFGLAPYVPAPFHVLSLRAPYRMGPQAHAWFDFTVAADGTRSIDEPQEAASRALVAQAVDQAARRLGIPAARVVVGGFSQGGIMALSLLLTQPALLQACMVWHSRLLPQALGDAAPAAALAGRRLWVSHGVQDNVIPLASAQAIRDHARGLPLALSYREYPGVHEIRPEELRDSMAWLQDLTNVMG